MRTPAPTTILKVLGAVLIIVIGAVGWTGFNLWRSWNAVEKVAFDLSASREALSTIPLETIQVASTSPDGVDEVDIGEESLPPELEIPPPVAVPDDLHGVFL